MSDVREALKRKFGGGGSSVPVSVSATATKASVSTKPKRTKITLRIPEEMMASLVLLKRVLGKDMNELCVDLLVDQVANKLSEARARVSPGEWDVIVKYAEGLDG
jgi:hypothetical protein